METKAWYESKVNWVSLFGMIAPFAVMWGLNIPADFWTLAAAFAVSAQNLLIFVMRTWFSPKVVAPSVK
jgi:hypothetical protein